MPYLKQILIHCAINTKNVVCHVFSECRPTYFWLDELNPWLPNLLYPLGARIMKIWAFEFKNFWKILPDVCTSLRCMNYENLSLWTKFFFKFLKTGLAIFWSEYAINTKNVVCHVFSESRPTYFWLDELNPWLPNLL